MRYDLTGALQLYVASCESPHACAGITASVVVLPTLQATVRKHVDMPIGRATVAWHVQQTPHSSPNKWSAHWSLGFSAGRLRSTATACSLAGGSSAAADTVQQLRRDSGALRSMLRRATQAVRAHLPLGKQVHRQGNTRQARAGFGGATPVALPSRAAAHWQAGRSWRPDPNAYVSLKAAYSWHTLGSSTQGLAVAVSRGGEGAISPEMLTRWLAAGANPPLGSAPQVCANVPRRLNMGCACIGVQWHQRSTQLRTLCGIVTA